MRKTKLWDALRFRFQKSVNVVPHCFVNLPRPVYSFHDAPVCWCFLLFSHVLTLILCFTLFLTVLTYGKRCFPGGYTSEISLTDLDRFVSRRSTGHCFGHWVFHGHSVSVVSWTSWNEAENVPTMCLGSRWKLVTLVTLVTKFEKNETMDELSCIRTSSELS